MADNSNASSRSKTDLKPPSPFQTPNSPPAPTPQTPTSRLLLNHIIMPRLLRMPRRHRLPIPHPPTTRTSNRHLAHIREIMLPLQHLAQLLRLYENIVVVRVPHPLVQLGRVVGDGVGGVGGGLNDRVVVDS